ncbi:hypothetical protein ABP1_0894 [Bacillus subtilis]|nr:hypothetical protein ABP1_0894 [Bacillus subtilis]
MSTNLSFEVKYAPVLYAANNITHAAAMLLHKMMVFLGIGFRGACLVSAVLAVS